MSHQVPDAWTRVVSHKREASETKSERHDGVVASYSVTVEPRCYVPGGCVFPAVTSFSTGPGTAPIELNALVTPLLRRNCGTVPASYVANCHPAPARAAILTFHVAWLGGLTMALAAQSAGGDNYDVFSVSASKSMALEIRICYIKMVSMTRCGPKIGFGS